ncbi:hypothetical protein B0H16DRAFT_1456138 [Mycena metata]|uniref:Uncharacterized protein n=1 Tax=Mycena metata TaxID=1033252 RepID=A0AAD7JBN3_9AGAR|nr:hypothetical protein B0H16DRAFT_1456138 [Mycena metata]
MANGKTGKKGTRQSKRNRGKFTAKIARSDSTLSTPEANVDLTISSTSDDEPSSPSPKSTQRLKGILDEDDSDLQLSPPPKKPKQKAPAAAKRAKILRPPQRISGNNVFPHLRRPVRIQAYVLGKSEFAAFCRNFRSSESMNSLGDVTTLFIVMFVLVGTYIGRNSRHREINRAAEITGGNLHQGRVTGGGVADTQLLGDEGDTAEDSPDP